MVIIMVISMLVLWIWYDIPGGYIRVRVRWNADPWGLLLVICMLTRLASSTSGTTAWRTGGLPIDPINVVT
jgi:hypothetical protein